MVIHPKLPHFLQMEFPLPWAMTRPERVALIQLVDLIRPPVAIEIGTQRGGSLQVIASRAGRVYSIDIDPAVAASLTGRFPNVEFRTGDSAVVLPAVLEEIEARGEELGFVLIDGDHTGPGVRQDINAVLRHVPRRPVHVLMHDSFNPPCRQGMLEAAWQGCPYVHHVELDFVGGVFLDHAPVAAPDMWGGFGLAVLLPERRTGGVVIHQALKDTFEALYTFSGHRPADESRFAYLRHLLRLAWRHPRKLFTRAVGKLGRWRRGDNGAA
ncbi:MAG TPA: class I SAM-dependent methyltransferase [Gemmataceae bacterium]|nr:class I SAM-dependent methyltransferase [Gemmataceae bacterium]